MTRLVSSGKEMDESLVVEWWKVRPRRLVARRVQDHREWPLLAWLWVSRPSDIDPERKASISTSEGLQ